MENNRSTDHRNLDLWQLHTDVAFGHAHGKVIWQPRILAWFTDKYFSGEPLPTRYQGMSEPDVYRDLGCSNRLYQYNGCFEMVDPPAVVRRHMELDETHYCDIVETPAGSMRLTHRRTSTNRSDMREKYWVETPEELKAAIWLVEHADWKWNQEHFDKVHQEWGRLGAPTMFLPRVNVQHLYIDLMGVERAVYAIYEWGAVIEDYFRVLHENHLRLIEVVNRSPIEIINFGDNLHCSTLSPSLYEEYVLPAYIDRCEKLHKAGKFVHSHWDGDTKALLKYARVSGLDGIEAITPKPQGDVTLEEVKEALGDKIVLLDGIPAVYFDKTFAEETLAECTGKVIKLFAPKLILGISDEMSSTGDIERVRLVGRIVDDYNAGKATP